MNQSTEPAIPEGDTAATVVPAQTAQAAPPIDPRRRLRELLSVPESVRTDAQWDEIIELEVQLAPGNRIGHDASRGGGGGGGGNRANSNSQQTPGNKGGGGFKRHGGRKFPKAKKPAAG